MDIFRKFNDIELSYLYTDKHVHSSWSDGQTNILQIAKKAQKLGLSQIAITEHIRASSKYFSSYAKEIDKARDKFALDILTGIETKICNFNGELDVREEVLKKSTVRIASVHRFPIGAGLYEGSNFKRSVCQEIELELSLAAIRKGVCNVLGHPAGMSIRAYKEFPLRYFEEIIIACKKKTIAFELNSAYHAPFINKLRILLKKYNPYVSLGSDAHSINEIGDCMKILRPFYE